jgi:hypothetical protein
LFLTPIFYVVLMKLGKQKVAASTLQAHGSEAELASSGTAAAEA